jgi:hypothetical protein
MEISPKKVFDCLDAIDRGDATESAQCRESAIDVLADPEVSLDWRDAIADRLNEVNLDLTIHSVDDKPDEESY